ncbi:MAG TPA: hypothetical protein VES00_18350, partial [Burkholderiaceae bacterium]|nr:hypothetical protein [Burkholderiaceae bacterium]
DARGEQRERDPAQAAERRLQCLVHGLPHATRRRATMDGDSTWRDAIEAKLHHQDRIFPAHVL